MSESTISALNDQMVEIPDGRIHLRDQRTNQTWPVDLEPFLVARSPVTQSIYTSISGVNPSTFIGDENPVENVSWYDTISFCNRLSKEAGLNACYLIDQDEGEVKFDPEANGYRLPFEAEWEYACRAGSQNSRYGDLDEIAWYKENSGNTSHPVREKVPNAWGLYDTLGNVWEWCWDLYDEVDYGSYRVFRGGGWCDPERGCLVTNRRRSHPTFRIDDLGFRLARCL